jgi:hypothetical protein
MTFAEELSSEIRARPAFYNEYNEYRAAACLGGLHHHIGDSGSGSIGSNRSMENDFGVHNG